MSSFGHILGSKHDLKVPKITNLVCFVPKPYLKTPKAQFFVINMIAGVEGKKRVENFRRGAAMLTKIVKNT